MLLGALSLPGSADWLLPAAGMLAAGLLLIGLGYGKAPALGWVKATCAGLKVTGLLLLLLCLLEPLWSGQRAKPGANLFLVLADNSQGMQIQDRGETQSRAEEARGLLTGDRARWLETLEDTFQVRRYTVDSRLRTVRDFSELTFDGRASSLGSALKTLDERFQGRPVAGVLLVSDGNATDLTEDSTDWEGLPPVYPVVVGSEGPARDLAIEKVAVTQTSFEDAPVSIQVDVGATGYEGARSLVQVYEVDHGGRKVSENSGEAKPVAEQSQKIAGNMDLLTYRFQLRPAKPGVVYYRLKISVERELVSFETEDRSEATLANNSRVVMVDRGEGPYRILFVAGRPNWEYKFLNRAVEEDPEIQMVGLIRVARREPKFDFKKGRSGETSNPLYRGFDRKDEETERYDQPVFVRLKTRDEYELRDGFPKTAEELYDYDAVVLDDLEVEFFTPSQRTLLQKFVSERGGGFFMLGGLESFQEGHYHRTPIGDMLPVYVDRPYPDTVANMRWEFTTEGWLEPWLRLRSTEVEERERMREMPFFEVLNQTRGIKPGATVLSRVTNSEGTAYPALVVQRFGRGRSGALLIGDFWRWGLRDEEVQEDLAKAWRQMMRWLVADVPTRIDLETREDRMDPNRPVLLEARVREKDYSPMDNALVTFEVRPVSEEPGASADPIRMLAEPAVSEPGLYRATYIPRETGGYYAEAVVTNSIGAEVGRAEAGWTIDLAADEFKSLKPNVALMDRIAKRTGGELVDGAGLAKFVDELPRREVPIKEDWTFPLWHQPVVFILALGCFIAEWGLRRWKGLV